MSTDQSARTDDALALASGSAIHRPRARRCDSCHSYSTGLIAATIADCRVRMCPDPGPCLRRAVAARAGLWMLWPP